jgi:hypothetical protein
MGWHQVFLLGKQYWPNYRELRKATNDPIYYVHTLLYMFLPWVLLFFISAYYEFKMLVKNKFRSNEYFTLTGIWIFYFIISASKNQVPNYIFSIVPLMAVLTAKWVDIAIGEKQKFVVFNYTQSFVSILLWLMIFRFILSFPDSKILFFIIATAGIGLSLFVVIKVKDKLTRLLGPSLIAFACLILLLNTHIFPYIFSYQAPPKAARYFTENAGETDKLYNYKYGQYELFFYSEPQAIQLKTEA